MHTGGRWQELLLDFKRGGLSLASAGLFVSQWSGKARESVFLWRKARKELGFGKAYVGSS